jgi:chromosome segregation protein
LFYIKKLEIYGFKSFGFKNTAINFEKGLIAITGPNGSGKSNVLDAIMFAIGENSPKALRVDKFQSLFHDSEHSSHRLIRVSLTFDNVNRGIPINSDSVILTREMEGQTGDSQYYLNDKKVSKSTIMELLEVVMPGPSKLNVVQQGMITRISELNSEERRKIIEDIIGLSYFDDKKTEALKQLEESDRRLEVALVKMGEIRKRIDELEAERNDQLRYQHLESELKRFKAIWISNKISTIKNELESQNRILDSNVLASSMLSKQLEDVRAEIENLESEKSAFIKKVDAENKAKAQVGSRIASIVYEAERTRAMLKQSQNRILEIEQQRSPMLDQERKKIVQQLDEFYHKVRQNNEIIAERSNKLLALKSELSLINSEIELLASKNDKYTRSKAELDDRYKRISWLRNNIAVSIARLEEKIRVNADKLILNESYITSSKAEIDNLNAAIMELSKSLQPNMTTLNSKTKLIEGLKNSTTKLERELSASRTLLDKAENLARTHEIRQDIIRNLNNEDATIAELIKDAATHGIKELAHSAIKYDKKYERAILAAASEWLKALIVNDTKSMILIAQYIKLRKLRRLKMIPLDILKHLKVSETLNYDVNVIGNLADFVYSDYENLPVFLFGNTFLVKTPTAAYILAQEGYRTVSVDGVLFEPSGRGLLLDFGSQISDLTKAIILTESVCSLRALLTNLKVLTEKKSSEFVDNIAKISDSKIEKVKAEAKIAGIRLQLTTLEASKSQTEKTLDQLLLDNIARQSEKDSWVNELKRYQKQMLLLTKIIDSLSGRIRDIDQVLAGNEDIRLNMMKKNHILKSIEELDIEIRELTTSSVSLNNQIEIGRQNLRGIDEQKQMLKSELEEMSEQVTSLTAKLESIESELRILRDKEQQVIDSSGSSYTVLQAYEQKIKELMDNEKKITKEHNAIEKETAMLRRDIADNSAEQSRLYNELLSLGYKEKDKLEAFDIDFTIKELTDELEATKMRINLRAHESYVQVIDGYRGISSRQNQLESERNSIVLFIEGVIKEKKAVFIDAFREVDEDIRKTFSEMTGGHAWLEIEDVEDIFSSGIMLMVQFPGKPGRESTALSGGEKTIAAAIFLLALQSLKPSPFYLMDEIDAHLDAENNDRLSRVLLSRSKDNQIIIVTLKDTTVAKADIIYGVYPKEGTSQIVKYKHSKNQAIAGITSNSNIQ